MSSVQSQLKALWRENFGDKSEYIDWFFSNYYRASRYLFLQEEEKIVSSLFLLQYTWVGEDSNYLLKYVVAGSTGTDYRGRGLYRELLEKAFQQAVEENALGVFLVPASTELQEYYSKVGYRPCFYRQFFRLQAEKMPDIRRLPGFDRKVEWFYSRPKELSEIYAYCCRKKNLRPCYVRIAPEDFEFYCQGWFLYSGGMLVCRDEKEEIRGVMLFFERDGLVSIREWIADDPETEVIILEAVVEKYSGKEVEWMKTDFRSFPKTILHEDCWQEKSSKVVYAMLRINPAYDFEKFFGKGEVYMNLVAD